MWIETIKNWIFNIAGIFIIWIILHYAAANLYAKFCAELSILGFIKSFFVSEAPHCLALRWLIYNGGTAIHTMWVTIGLWCTNKLLTSIFTNSNVETNLETNT